MLGAVLVGLLFTSIHGGYINLGSSDVNYDNLSEFKSAMNEDLQQEITALEAGLAASVRSTDILWLIFSACLVFWMQAGFALVEVGSVSMKNTKNILVKNVLDACIGCLSFYLIGFAFAFGGNNSFIGGYNFALVDVHKPTGTGSHYDGERYAFWMFQFAFAATASTIVSGAVAERCRVVAYFVYSFALTVFIYPVVVHWVWSDYGWASAFISSSDRLFGVGVIDFAGSSVVHMVGGMTALVAAIFLGPRKGRFGPKKFKLAQQSAAFQTLGVLILWFGWYGFNCGSTLTMEGTAADVAGSVAATTSIAATSAGVTSTILSWFVDGNLSIGRTNNGILGGLVSITAGCAVVTPGCAVAIGILGALCYYGASIFLEWLEIDDVVDASPVHLVCGMWGTLAAGIFAHPENTAMAYDNGSCGIFYTCEGNGKYQFAANLILVLAVIAWAGVFGVLVFLPLKVLGLLRVDLETERVGLDTKEHGGGAYEMEAPVRRHSIFTNRQAESGNSVKAAIPDLPQVQEI